MLRTAAFQIDVGSGAVYLVCVPIPSLRAACDLESWLNTHVGPKCEIKFLGRFDRIQTCTTVAEIKARIAEDFATAGSLGSVVSIEIGMRKLRSS